MTTGLYPLRLTPVYKNYLWGGNRIRRLFKRQAGPDVCAESWEISDRPEGMSVVANGPLMGRTLHDIVVDMGSEMLGAAARTSPRSKSCSETAFPLLIKIIDARERLSVQVHPDERTARITGGEPKTEMWYVLDAQPGATIFCGIKPGVTRAAFETAIDQGNFEDLMLAIPARKDEAIFVPAGRVHAIGEGCLLLEIQQNSNTTYRIYDWGRRSADGRPRELHIRKALQAINWNDRPAGPIKPRRIRTTSAGNGRDRVVSAPCFRVSRIHLTAPATVRHNRRTFHALFVVSGKLSVAANQTVEVLLPGNSCLLPAALSRYQLTPLASDTTLIRMTL